MRAAVRREQRRIARARRRPAARDVHRDAGGAERRLRDPSEASAVAHEVLEVGVIVDSVTFGPPFEVVVDDGQHESVGLRRDVRADVADLLLALR